MIQQFYLNKSVLNGLYYLFLLISILLAIFLSHWYFLVKILMAISLVGILFLLYQKTNHSDILRYDGQSWSCSSNQSWQALFLSQPAVILPFMVLLWVKIGDKEKTHCWIIWSDSLSSNRQWRIFRTLLRYSS